MSCVELSGYDLCSNEESVVEGNFIIKGTSKDFKTGNDRILPPGPEASEAFHGKLCIFPF